MTSMFDKKRYLFLNGSPAQRMKTTACFAAKKDDNKVNMQKIVKQRWREFWMMLDSQLLDKYPSLATKLGYIEGITGIKKEHVLIGFLSLIVLYVGTAYFASISSDFISLAYPLYCSVKAKEAADEELRNSWLTYWIVYSALVLTEYFAGRILSILPAYFLVRTAFVVWCMAPYPENGSNFVYNKFIQPSFVHHQGQMESAFHLATAEMTSLGRNVISGHDENGNKKED